MTGSSAFGLKRGTVIGQYRIIRPIGKGGMGLVYEAFEEGLNRRVAIKMIHEEALQDAEATRRFELEGRALARVNHPHVVTVFNLGRYNDIPYLAMEYVEGANLRDYLGQRVFPEREAIPLFRQLLQGVEALHRSGVLHRDLKPHNIIYQPNHEVKIVDFGVAKMMLSTGNEITGAGMIVGSVKYISPEGAQGAPVTIQSDVWSLGVLFYQMLVGETPFEAKDYREVLEKVKSAKIQFPIFSKIFIGKELREIILGMLERPLERRFSNTNEVLQRIDQYLNRTGGDPLFKPTTENLAILNIKNEASLYQKLKKHGFDTFRTKMILTMALNEQAKIDGKKYVGTDDSDSQIGLPNITISEAAIAAAITNLEASQQREPRIGNVERRRVPRPSKRKIDKKLLNSVAVAVALVAVPLLLKLFTPSQTVVQTEQELLQEKTRQEQLAKQAEAARNIEEFKRAEAERIEREREQELKLRAKEKRKAAAEKRAQEKKYAAAKAAAEKAAAKRARQEKAEAAKRKIAAEKRAKELAEKSAQAAIKKAQIKRPKIKNIVLDVPQILSPVNETTISSTGRSPASVLFIWKAQKDATFYDIEFSIAPDFKEPIISESVSLSQYNLDRLLPYGTVHWRVRARNGHVTSGWSRTQKLLVETP